ncbi:MAG: hypothetical protein QOH98_2211 [Methylobacteriaceae bacterium]|jgi:uncharacterized protein YcbK (DUF882 family)|nr:hypothetical protein [Methylobacteriaceae bacterium]
MGPLAALLAALIPGTTETCIANGDTRTLYLFHSHTKESIAATYRVNGQYDQAALEKLNWFLRDWRSDDATKMDPRLFDAVWETYRTAGGNSTEDPVVIVSAYRSPKTNAMLRRRSRAVAEHSQHMLGKAMDTTMPNMSMEKVREVGMKLQRGGVGYYGASNFVHLDVGSVRAWPRMSYDQLARLFPDGKTVHLAADGRALARYEEARAEIEATGGIAQDAPSRGKGFFAFLFGGGRDEEEETAEAASAPRRGWASNRTQIGAAPSRGATAQVAVAAADDGGRNLFVAQAYRDQPARPVQQAERNLPRGETYMSPGPAASPANTKVAAAEPTAAPENPAGEAVAAIVPPLPPRRSEDFPTAAIPLPPARPVQLASVIAQPVRRPVAAYAASAPELDGTAAIRGLIEAAQGSRQPGLPNVITEGTSILGKAPQQTALAYAPAGGATPGLRAVALGRPYLSKEAIGGRVDFVAARLDRSNFRALTGSSPATRMTTQTVLGPALAAPRAASRADFDLFAAAPAAGYVTGFGRIATDLPVNSFAPPALNLARATIN